MEISNNTYNGQCSRCGQCCTTILPITRKEAQKIKDYVKLNNIEPINRLTNNSISEQCPFCKDNKCLVYEVRPFVCKDFKCDHKNWKQRRDFYGKRAYFNGVKKQKIKHFATLQELIYDDIGFTLQLMIELIKLEKHNNNIEYEDFIKALKVFDRMDIFPYLKFVFKEVK